MSKELKLYRPSNGDEGDWFTEAHCARCVHDQAFRERREGYGCDILVRTMFLDVGDENYPREWCYDAEGHPTCTKFKQKPENDGDDDAPPPIPADPLQLVLLADPTEDAAIFAEAEPERLIEELVEA